MSNNDGQPDTSPPLLPLVNDPQTIRQVVSIVNKDIVTVVVHGTLAEAATFTIMAPQAGTYLLEFGAQQMDSTTGTGNVKSLTADSGGTSAVYSDTGSSGAIGIQTGVVLTHGQVVTLTCNHVSGSAVAGLLGTWAKLTRIS